MSPYKNLFYPFKQKENQATKAFLSTLDFLGPQYMKIFIETILGDEINSKEFTYTMQGLLKGRDYEKEGSKNYLLCIANTTDVEVNSSDKDKSRPDGGIFTTGLGEQVNIAIETKIGTGKKLNRDQIGRHLLLFGSNEPVVIYKTWDDIKKFFGELEIDAENELAQTIIKQFEDFCVVYDLGTNERNHDFWLAQFHMYYDIACEIDEFLLSGLIGLDVAIQKNRNKGIGYNIGKSKRFAKLHVSGTEYVLILTFGYKHNNLAPKVRSKYNLEPMKNTGYEITHEVWIPLEWIATEQIRMDTVMELCKKAYEVNYKGKSI